MAKDVGGTPAPRRGRPRLAVFGLAGLVLVGVVLATVLLLSRGDGLTASGKRYVFSCQGGLYRTGLCPTGKKFDPARYINHGDGYDCVELASQADAQAVLRLDPTDPNHFDTQRNGIACPELPGPKDLKPVLASAKLFKCYKTSRRSARCPQPSRKFYVQDYLRYGADEHDCDEFASQADAQKVLRFEPDDPNKLDTDGNGIACPDLPAPKDLVPVLRKPAS